jgi:TPR repeat protein
VRHLAFVLVVAVALAATISLPASSGGDPLSDKATALFKKMVAAGDDVGSSSLLKALDAYSKSQVAELKHIKNLYFCDKGLMDVLPLRRKACSLLGKMQKKLESAPPIKPIATVSFSNLSPVVPSPATPPAPAPAVPASGGCEGDLASKSRLCDAGNGAACYCAGVALFDAEKIGFYLNNYEPQEIFPGSTFKTVTEGLEAASQALDFYRKGCALNEVRSCHNAGLVMRGFNSGDYEEPLDESSNEYKEIMKEVAEMLGFFVKACELGHADGCHLAGRMQMNDWSKAKPYFEKGCKLGNDESCGFLRVHQ